MPADQAAGPPAGLPAGRPADRPACQPADQPVKCVVWDLDGTIWHGVAVELPAGQRPAPLPRALHAIATLAERGIVNSLASRTDPSVAAFVDGHPALAGRFVAAQLGWGHKSDAVRRIAAELGISPGAIAFVDDDPFERAEVAAMLPGVLAMSPAELYDRLDTPRFRPAVVTEDGRRRPERYRAEQRRRHAESVFAGDRAEFLRACGMRLAIAPATAADLDRLAELVARTHRFNSTGRAWRRYELAALIEDARWFVPVARLSDRFGDYGLIGAALLEGVAGPAPRLHLFTVSCRAIGRGVPAAFLGWVLARARAADATKLRMDVREQQANVELRVLLRGSGFEDSGDAGLLVRRLDAEPSPPAPWLTVTDATAGPGVPPPADDRDRPAIRPEAAAAAAVEAAVEAAPIEVAIRQLLASAMGVEQAAVDRLPATTDLLHGPLPLGSLAGARLLAAIHRRFGVDVAAEDLGLDSLRSVATLRDFIGARLGAAAPVSASAAAGAATPVSAGAAAGAAAPDGSGAAATRARDPAPDGPSARPTDREPPGGPSAPPTDREPPASPG